MWLSGTRWSGEVPELSQTAAASAASVGRWRSCSRLIGTSSSRCLVSGTPLFSFTVDIAGGWDTAHQMCMAFSIYIQLF